MIRATGGYKKATDRYADAVRVNKAAGKVAHDILSECLNVMDPELADALLVMLLGLREDFREMSLRAVAKRDRSESHYDAYLSTRNNAGLVHDFMASGVATIEDWEVYEEDALHRRILEENYSA